MDGLGVPDEHVAGPDLEVLFPVLPLLQALHLNVDEDSLGGDYVVVVATGEVDGGPVVSGRGVHRDPEAEALLGDDGPVLVVLVPLETLVRVDHEQVRANPNLVAPTHLAEDVADGGVVVKVCEGLVRLPDVALDVIVQLGSGSGEAPEVGLFGLLGSRLPHVLNPLLVEHSLQQHHPVPLQDLDILLRHRVSLGRGSALLNPVG
mmetsp:Transcript_19579/g.36435  ORF Transcript_19579/g.36435 Transcript_19579/m.36435 type:complete len:205 (-) Transcript_19579:305-919(-)